MTPGGASPRERWAIVGGGMLGLTLALRLARADRDITVLESADHVGGLASAWRLGDVVWDQHYHVTLLSDSELRGVLADLGLEAEMRWVETRTGYYADGHLSSVSNTVEFLRLPALSLVDKLRLGATILYGSKVRDWQRLEHVPVAEWLTRLSGRRTFERFWRPLLVAKLGESYHEASAAFIWATIQRLYAARRTGLKKELFGYVPGGYARVLARFAEVLEARGVRIRLGARVEGIERVEPRVDDPVPRSPLRVRLAEGEEAFDRVIVTANADVASRLCPGLTEREHEELRGIRYQGIVCASLLLRRPLGDYYLTYVLDPVPFTAVVEMTAFVDRRELDGHALVYLPKYVAPDDPLFEEADEVIESRFVDALARLYPGLSLDDVLAFRVSRVRRVFAVPTLGYSASLPPMRTSVAGLHIVTSAHIVNGTLNVNETVQLAEAAARRLDAAARSEPAKATPSPL